MSIDSDSVTHYVRILVATRPLNVWGCEHGLVEGVAAVVGRWVAGAVLVGCG